MAETLPLPVFTKLGARQAVKALRMAQGRLRRGVSSKFICLHLDNLLEQGKCEEAVAMRLQEWIGNLLAFGIPELWNADKTILTWEKWLYWTNLPRYEALNSLPLLQQDKQAREARVLWIDWMVGTLKECYGV